MVARIMEEMKKAAAAAAAEEGASDDEEAMDLTKVKEKLEALTEKELKQMLKEMKLPTQGKKEDMVARIIESMQKEADEEEDDDDSEEEEDDEPEAEAASKSAGKRARPADAEPSAA